MISSWVKTMFINIVNFFYSSSKSSVVFSSGSSKLVFGNFCLGWKIFPQTNPFVWLVAGKTFFLPSFFSLLFTETIIERKIFRNFHVKTERLLLRAKSRELCVCVFFCRVRSNKGGM